jgi:hypothetical protein
MIGGGVIELMALTATAICFVDLMTTCIHVAARRLERHGGVYILHAKQATASALSIDDAAPKVPGKTADAICPICLDDLAEVADVRKTRCGHPFCAPCFETWYARSPRCPLCNEDFSASAVPVLPMSIVYEMP